MSALFQFMSGALLMGFGICGIFFLRFWRRTQDRLFLMFAIAFFIFSFERVLLFVYSNENRAEDHPLVYLCRLFGFGIIIYGIVGKNLAEERSHP